LVITSLSRRGGVNDKTLDQEIEGSLSRRDWMTYSAGQIITAERDDYYPDLAAGSAPAGSAATIATTVRSVAGSAAAGGGPLHAGNDSHRSIDGRSTVLLSLAATDLVAVILVIDNPIALIEIAIEDVQGTIIIMPELLPAFFFFAAVVAYFVRASPESPLGGVAAVTATGAATCGTGIARAAEISLGIIADHQQAQTGQQDEHELSHGHSLIAGGPGARLYSHAVPPAPLLAQRTLVASLTGK